MILCAVLADAAVRAQARRQQRQQARNDKKEGKSDKEWVRKITESHQKDTAAQKVS